MTKHKAKSPDQLYVVVCDGWIPDRYYSMDQYDEMLKYLYWCRYAYQGTWDYRICDASHPRRFMRAILNERRAPAPGPV